VQRAAFLDRDGVLNQSNIINGLPSPPRNLTELKILPGVEIGLLKLKRLGLKTIVVTNQPDVARGTDTIEQVNEINNFLEKNLPIDYFYICPHDNSDNCECRKPKAGLILTAAQDHKINLPSSYLVGDRWRDVAAGQAAGCKCFFIDYKYPEESPSPPFTRVSSLLAAAKKIEKEIEQ
jgi:D-glycero-D-manno-heptose 1,7-bisphosphate phosphatase